MSEAYFNSHACLCDDTQCTYIVHVHHMLCRCTLHAL